MYIFVEFIYIQIVFKTPEKNYTLNDYNLLFKKFGIDNYLFYKSIISNTQINKKLDVYTLFIYSKGVKTLERLSSYQDEYKEEFGDGDGTVNIQSLEHCLKYYHKDSLNTEIIVLNNIQHHKILKSQKLFDILEQFINKRKKIWNETNHRIYRCHSSIF